MPVAGGGLAANLSTQHFLLSTGLRFAQGAIFLKRHPGLLHGRQGSIFVRIIKPAALPEILIHMAGRYLGTTLAMQRRAVDRSGNMDPIHHGKYISRLVTYSRQHA